MLSRETLRLPGVQITTCNPINASESLQSVSRSMCSGENTALFCFSIFIFDLIVLYTVFSSFKFSFSVFLCQFIFFPLVWVCILLFVCSIFFVVIQRLGASRILCWSLREQCFPMLIALERFCRSIINSPSGWCQSSYDVLKRKKENYVFLSFFCLLATTK